MAYNGPFCEQRDEMEIELCREAVRQRKPIFGICRGLQAMAVTMGGTLYQDLITEVGGNVQNHRQWGEWSIPLHSVDVLDGSLLARIIGGRMTIEVNSFHHQAVRDVPAGFRCTATAPDGVAEAIEATGAATLFGTPHEFTLGVQWHPERMLSEPHAQALFEAFANACRDIHKHDS